MLHETCGWLIGLMGYLPFLHCMKWIECLLLLCDIVCTDYVPVAIVSDIFRFQNLDKVDCWHEWVTYY